jgi:hypothetical protein
MLRPSSLIRTVAALRHQTFQSHAAGRSKQLRPDLALFERRDEDAVRSPRQQASKVGLAPKAYSCTSSSFLRECSALKSAMPSMPSTTASPSITNWLIRFFKAASTIHG